MDIFTYSKSIKIQWEYLTQNPGKYFPLTRWPRDRVLLGRGTVGA